MKKIPISNFRKKHGVELFAQVSDAVRKSNCDNHVLKNSSVNINKIIQQLPEDESKKNKIIDKSKVKTETFLSIIPKLIEEEEMIFEKNDEP